MTDETTPMLDDKQIWDECFPALDSMEPECSLAQMVQNEDPVAIGLSMEALLMKQMADREGPGGVVLAVTKNECAKVHIAHETHAQRMWASRLAGRFFANELQDPIEYLIQIFPVWVGDQDYDGPVGENPHRTEAAMTVVMEMRSLYAAETLDQYQEALSGPTTRGWFVNMHEGLPTDVKWDGAVLYTESQRPEDHKASDDPKADQYIANQGLTEILVGLSGSLPVIQKITASEELQQELEQKVAEKELQEAK